MKFFVLVSTLCCASANVFNKLSSGSASPGEHPFRSPSVLWILYSEGSEPINRRNVIHSLLFVPGLKTNSKSTLKSVRKQDTELQFVNAG